MSVNNLPDLDWLIRRWNLPASPDSQAMVKQVLGIQLEGNTAFAIHGDPPALGAAANFVAAGEELPETPTPLVIIRGGTLWAQSWLYYKTEREIASFINKRVRSNEPLAFDASRLGGFWDNANEQQRKAVQTALQCSLMLLTGGPGTGKTVTVALMLRALHEAWNKQAELRVILAAPTGKAADQMKASVSRGLGDLPEEHREYFKQIAEHSRTLHKTLGYNGDNGGFKYGRNNRLPCDVLVLDEASMCDTLLFGALLRALPDQARLIIVGDPHQLPSVEPGDVLGELVRFAKAPGSLLGQAWVHLVDRMRVNPSASAIVELAKAFEERSSTKVAEVLRRPQSPVHGLIWLERTAHQPISATDFPEAIMSALSEVARTRDPQEALAQLSKTCVLSPFRQHSAGAQKLNAKIDEHFARLLPGYTQPIIINRNDAETGLKNGSVGVIVTDPESQERIAYFTNANPAELASGFPISRLPEFSPAWVLTVHRSQGSEFNQVLVIMPNEESQMNSRELIYTAITRAKNNVFILGSLEAVQKAAENSFQRVSMLCRHLQAMC